MKLAQQSWEEGSARGTQALLEPWRPAAGQEELRGFEWRYLWHLCHTDAALFTLHPRWPNALVWGLAFASGGRILASAGYDDVITLWDLGSRR